MLHAFFLEDTTLGGTTYRAGSEAFAFLPPDLLPVVRLQYSQGGQKPDPRGHIFGLANSPKVKSLCVQNCGDAVTAVWKTLLIMPEGYGGGETFVLDVTAPFGPSGLADPPVRVQWHTGYGPSAATYDTWLGNTISLGSSCPEPAAAGGGREHVGGSTPGRHFPRPDSGAGVWASPVMGTNTTGITSRSSQPRAVRVMTRSS
jgi:hypothetical protein